jgi:hypothetical protein
LSNTISGLIYYVTRYGMSEMDGGTRRIYLTIIGDWTSNRDEAERFNHKELAWEAASRFPYSFVDGFMED